MIAFTDDTLLERDSDALFTELDDLVVIMDLDSGDYLELDVIGAQVWERIASPVRFGDLCAGLVAEYAVSDAKCRDDVGKFLEGLIEKNLARTRIQATRDDVSP